MFAIRMRGQKLRIWLRGQSVSPWIMPTKPLPRFRETAPSWPTALDPAKTQAPVWRKNFGSTDSRMPGHSKADTRRGSIPAYLSSRNQKQLSLLQGIWRHGRHAHADIQGDVLVLGQFFHRQIQVLHLRQHRV